MFCRLSLVGSVYPRELIVYSNDVVVFCWGTCRGMGVGGHRREVSLCCRKAPFTSEDATGQCSRVRILGTCHPSWTRGGGCVRIAKIAKESEIANFVLLAV